MTPPNQPDTGQTGSEEEMRDQAIHWLLRQRAGDMTAMEWEELTHWLEADAAHAHMLDQLVASDEALSALDTETVSPPAAISAANDNPISRYIQFAMASAAALVLAVLIWPASEGPAGSFVTQPGEVQIVALTDEVTMTLNGDSAVEVSEGEPTVEIERGEVAFAIQSEEPSALRVKVADLVLADYGTIFNVSLSDETVSVSVAEGIVAVNPDAQNVQIAAGEQIQKALDSPTLERSAVARDLVGAWREGRLEFDNTPIADALLQLRRSKGLEIKIAPRHSNVRLTGSLSLSNEEAVIVAAMEEFVGGTAARRDSGWIID